VREKRLDGIERDILLSPRERVGVRELPSRCLAVPASRYVSHDDAYPSLAETGATLTERPVTADS